mmetsp:Transcript_110861/g.324331  ORF Transcript_110861/g.324331 Transcript_110861/m.324331 type:complete len:237 (-) Transcript_110861:214-924(-)
MWLELPRTPRKTCRKMSHASGSQQGVKKRSWSKTVLSAALLAAIFCQATNLSLALTPSGWPRRPLETASALRTAVQRAAGKAMTLETLTIGSKVKGTVTRVNPLSADVDIGVSGARVNYHLAEFSTDRIDKAGDVFAVGDEVSAAVFKFRMSFDEIQLAPVDHPNFKKKPLQSFSTGETLTGKLVGKNGKCAFFDVGAMTDGMLPVGSLGDLSIGDTMKLRVTKVGQWSLELEPAS